MSATGAGTRIGSGTTLTGIENINLVTGSGADLIDPTAASGNDIVATGSGDDVILMARGTQDSANGGAGKDSLTNDAALAAAVLRMSYIGSGWDRVQATDGSDTADINWIEALTFLGSCRSNRVYDFGGVDHLNGRAGNDVLAGGAGADLFSFQTFAPQAVTR